MFYLNGCSFTSFLLSIALAGAQSIWPQVVPTPEQVRCASLLAGATIPASLPLVKAMNWRGPINQRRNFFFERESLNEANQSLKAPGPFDDVDFWTHFFGAGFDCLITVKSQDGLEILGKGRLTRQESDIGIKEDKIIVKEVSLFTGSSISVQRQPICSFYFFL